MLRIGNIVAGLALGLAGILPAHAEYPDKPIRLIVGFVPGGGSDIAARIFAEALGRKIGQTVIVENKPGAGSAIGVDYVAKAAPDGYTILQTNSDGISILPAVKKHVPYSVPKDFSFITRIVNVSEAVAISTKEPFTTLQGMIDYAKAHPGKLRYGTSGIGTGPHLATLLMEQAAGIKMTVVPYQGSGAAINDLVGGFIDMDMPAVQAIAALDQAGKVRVVAVTGPERDPSLPDVPTMAEAGLPSATVSIWYGIMGPPGLPAAILAKLRTASLAALNDDAFKKKFEAAGFEPAPLVGDDFEKAVIKEYGMWKEIAAANHISLD